MSPSGCARFTWPGLQCMTHARTHKHLLHQLMNNNTGPPARILTSTSTQSRTDLPHTKARPSPQGLMHQQPRKKHHQRKRERESTTSITVIRNAVTEAQTWKQGQQLQSRHGPRLSTSEAFLNCKGKKRQQPLLISQQSLFPSTGKRVSP